MRQTVKHLLKNTLLLKLLTVVMFFFLIFPALKPIVDGYVKIVLLFGGIQFLYSVFTKRDFLKARNMIWLVLFLIMEAITILLNYHVGFKDNVSLLCYTAVAMFMLYPNDEQKQPQVLIKEMWLIGLVYIALCAAASAVSLLTFVLHYEGTHVYAGTLYFTGVYEGRLWGIYSNPNFPAAMIAAAISIIQFPVCRKVTLHKNRRIFQYAMLVICFTLNFWYTVLAQSRGSLIALLAFLCIFIFFWLRKKVLFHKNAKFSYIASGLGAVISIILIGLSTPFIIHVSEELRDVNNVTITDVSNQETVSNSQNMSTEHEENLEIGRDPQPEQTDVLTGRQILWKKGFEKFSKKPIFGYGNIGSTKGVTLYDDNEIKHFHNVIVHSLVSVGLAGTLVFILFAVLSFANIIRYLYYHRGDSWDNMGVICGCIAFIVMYIVNNTVEVYLIFNVNIPNFIFWIYFGYLITLIMRGTSYTKADKLLHRLSHTTSNSMKGEVV